jgi:hypothetical protein
MVLRSVSAGSAGHHKAFKSVTLFSHARVALEKESAFHETFQDQPLEKAYCRGEHVFGEECPDMSQATRL